MTKVYPELKFSPVITQCNNGGSGLEQKKFRMKVRGACFDILLLHLAILCLYN